MTADPQTGWLKVVGLGPGTEDWLTPEARRDLAEATDLIGYFPYVDRVPPGPQVRHASDNRVELDRARHALELAAEGRRVAVVSGGDPGIFAMAAAVFEALDDPAAPAAWHRVQLSVDPGISAMQAAAARAGAPLGHDFCAISLSDNLKPWEVVLKRLHLAAEADFVIALYNPISRARPWQLGAAFDALRDLRSAETPVILAQAVGRPDEALTITTLGAVDAAQADMRTCVIIGASHTRLVPREGAQPWVYTPRSYGVRG
ncbi:precorrin-3B C17-methyltransferase (plasmid) [Azospirillum argentinense]|uniref:Precorrin-3B C(17)-methyltransferase n=1 Tax=Azospirillum argentinense TaxID=2970906 RepID=A0A060DTA1_9PROT|nr:precorrin-3B C(17)-methyltransferase [Azospirillum argentinense]AIB14189.1 precorrin-3B C17-methyltransferase [Azospirillum argentinense]EZQ05566.1 precorrin-3B C17-methyltransferase [Azospirillum argentinense]PNQ99529.1 precorrin-3B C(17)-methyltransferase [Azospirillum argentinense]